MGKIDIRPIKNKLRAYHKSIRKNMPLSIKQKKDEKIFQKIIALDQFQSAETLMTFVSTPIEVDTQQLITYALSKGKTVAVPRCAENKVHMDFFTIQSLDDLSPGTFSVLEPRGDRKNLLKSFKNSICIVPGLAFDIYGYRLGYGKGYYDRFLNIYTGLNVGICYSDCIQNSLPHSKHDKPVRILITDKYKRTI